ncbi:NUDIX hydrolase [Aureibacillus halotolerans]|uniref:Uncharacterized protein n=1 Tax=Aureibacillus halotolerans TaxID=1508390 RepID=A0A4R6U8B0_9BACI|nr:NUDIX domain-containing protein [Aureibacillus halotolerans]TDQ40845.1 hypothetical protein EV213_105191 [Aureibacillus halotolerans]
MKTEQLAVFNEAMERIGVASREEVHRKGHWHETFHCWIAYREGETIRLLFQMRSPNVKDFKGLLDITAAGHLLAEETVLDGVREVEEELGLPITMEDIVQVATIPCTIEEGTFIDREFVHVFLYGKKVPFEAFHVQVEEVAGLYEADLDHFVSLWNGERGSIHVTGFAVGNGKQRQTTIEVTKGAFVPHPDHYVQTLIDALKKTL